MAECPGGDRFQIGDGVRTDKRSAARLELNNGSLFNLEAGTQVRFLKHLKQRNDAKVDLEIGKTEVVVGADGLRLEIGHALAVFDPNAKGRLKRHKDQIHFDIDFGRARLFSNAEGNGSSRTIKKGETITLMLGEMKIVAPSDNAEEDVTTPHDTDSKTPPRDIDINPPIPNGFPPKRAGATDKEEGISAPIDKADFRVRTGETFTVHVPSPPVAIAFPTAEICPNGAILRVGKKEKWSGIETIIAKLETGRNVYRVLCRDEETHKKPSPEDPVLV